MLKDDSPALHGRVAAVAPVAADKTFAPPHSAHSTQLHTIPKMTVTEHQHSHTSQFRTARQPQYRAFRTQRKSAPSVYSICEAFQSSSLPDA